MDLLFTKHIPLPVFPGMGSKDKDKDGDHREQKVSVASLIQPEREGFLVKQGGVVKNWKKRWFVLKGKTLYYFNTRQDSVQAGQMHLNAECEIADGSAKTGQKDSLEIRTPERTYYVYAEPSATSKADIADWQAALLRVTKKGAPKEKKGKNVKAVQLWVRGIMCECCERTVHTAITKHKGVTGVEIEAEQNKVTVKGRKVEPEMLIASLENEGFFVCLVGE